jgi:hypothetical protein
MVWTRKALHQAILGKGGVFRGGALRLDLKVRNYNPYWKYQVNAQFSGVQCASWEG